MKDLFLECESAYQSFKQKSDLYNKLSLFQFDILDDIYKNILILEQGVDSFCTDYIDFRDYTLLVGNEHKSKVKRFVQYLEQLKKELDTEFACYRDKVNTLLSYSVISFSELLELFSLFNINYVDIMFPDGIYNDTNKIKVTILEGGIPAIYEFIDFMNLIDIEEGEIRFNSDLEYLFGSDFIMFYVNYKCNNPNCDISGICIEYKNTCLNR